MSHFAFVDENDIVQQVLVIEQEMVNTGLFGDPSRWIQTSYNTRAGVHKFGKEPLRKNYAGIGFKYCRQRDAFIPPKPPFKAWILNEDTCQWEPPIPYPVGPEHEGKIYMWKDEVDNWVALE